MPATIVKFFWDRREQPQMSIFSNPKRRQAMTTAICCWLVGAAVLLGNAAVAQETDPATTRAAAQRSVVGACADENKRFCPPSPSGVPSARDEVICLKGFMLDLSPGCRQAVSGSLQ
jgi:hypothetical protein